MLWAEPEVAEIPVYWNNDGITYKVKQTEEDGDYLRKIWTVKQDELKERYRGESNLSFCLESSRRCSFSIQIDRWVGF